MNILMEKPIQILTLDDDPGTLDLVKHTLYRAGFTVKALASVAQGIDYVDRHGLPHLAIVDIHMPPASGIDFCRHIRLNSNIPIIMLTAVHDEDIIVQTLEEFAEDFIHKPFRPAELVSRVRRILRRVENFDYTDKPILEVDSRLQIDIPGKVLYINGKSCDLTPTEAKMLHILLRNAGRPVTIETLLQKLWVQESVNKDKVHVHIHRLRQKIEKNPKSPQYIISDRGMGYRFEGMQL
jgi:DNA-binding response OmpR family regulator